MHVHVCDMDWHVLTTGWLEIENLQLRPKKNKHWRDCIARHSAGDRLFLPTSSKNAIHVHVYIQIHVHVHVHELNDEVTRCMYTSMYVV